VSFLDNLFRNITAQQLATTGAPVNVSAADPPEANQVLKRGADATHAVWGAVPGGGGGGTDTTVLVVADTLSPEVDHAYYLFAACTVTLPDATLTGNVGKRITMTFSQPRNLVRGESLESPNSLVDALGQAVAELPNLPAGTYVFEALLDTGVSPAGLWVMHQLALVDAGVIDVDWCYPEELPIYSVTPVGTGTRYQLEGTGDSPDKLKLDGTGNYTPGQTLLVAFDIGAENRIAVFKVVNNDAADDWQLESLYVFPDAEETPNRTELEYRIVFGDQWGGRRFRTNTKGNAYLPPNYVLQRDPLECWPPDELLDGTASGSHAPHLGNVLLAGRNNMLNVGASHTVTLLCPSTDFTKGERFAITVAQGGANAWTIDVSGTDAVGIGDQNGTVDGTSVTLNLHGGTYVEWQLCADEVWRVVSYIEGTDPG
jgi:hypothetical protein